MAVLVAAGSVTLAISSAPLAGETITMRVVAGIAIIGAVMLWIRSHYSLYTWSAFLGSWHPGIIDVHGDTSTVNSAGKLESESHISSVPGGYYSATSSQVAAAVKALGGTSAINQALIAANPDWVHNFGKNLANDVSQHPLRTFGRALGIAGLIVDPPTTMWGVGLAIGAAAGDAGSAIWEDK